MPAPCSRITPENRARESRPRSSLASLHHAAAGILRPARQCQSTARTRIHPPAAKRERFRQPEASGSAPRRLTARSAASATHQSRQVARRGPRSARQGRAGLPIPVFVAMWCRPMAGAWIKGNGVISLISLVDSLVDPGSSPPSACARSFLNRTGHDLSGERHIPSGRTKAQMPAIALLRQMSGFVCPQPRVTSAVSPGRTAARNRFGCGVSSHAVVMPGPRRLPRRRGRGSRRR